MKITKEKLMEIIKEELNEVEGLAGGDMGGDTPVVDVGADETVEKSPAVEQIVGLLDKINTPEEYEEVLEAILNHGNNIAGKDEMMDDLQSQLAEIKK